MTHTDSHHPWKTIRNQPQWLLTSATKPQTDRLAAGPKSHCVFDEGSGPQQTLNLRSAAHHGTVCQSAVNRLCLFSHLHLQLSFEYFIYFQGIRQIP